MYNIVPVFAVQQSHSVIDIYNSFLNIPPGYKVHPVFLEKMLLKILNSAVTGNGKQERKVYFYDYYIPA